MIRTAQLSTFLKSSIWGFSARSLFTAYGQLFLWRMAFTHPLRLLKALCRFPPLSVALSRAGLVVTDARNEFNYDIVAGSFCQKPFNCPVGRFNHRCLKVEIGSGRLPNVCKDCPLGHVTAVAASQQADFYIMTSALDIAHDLFLPNLRQRQWRRGLFVLCPYSAQPFLLAMLVAGFEGTLVTFCCGDCRSYREFTLADRGVKPQQTRVAPDLWQRFFCQAEASSVFLEKKGNLYRSPSRTATPK